MNGNLTPVLIVAIVMFAIVMKARYRALGGHGEARRDRRMAAYDEADDPRVEAENARLRSEVQQLKDRVKVLERIAVDKENSLAREIDDLRDR